MAARRPIKDFVEPTFPPDFVANKASSVNDSYLPGLSASCFEYRFLLIPCQYVYVVAIRCAYV